MENFVSEYQKRWEAERQQYLEEKRQRARLLLERNQAFYRDIGNFIKKHREHRGISQTTLGRKLNCSNLRIADFENARGRISLFRFAEICRILKIDYDYCGGLQLTPEEKEWVEILRRRDTKAVAEWLAHEI